MANEPFPRENPRVRRMMAAALSAAGLVTLLGPATGATEQLTKAEFITAADELCTETDQFLFYVTVALTEEGQTTPPSDAQIEEFSQHLVSSYRELIGEIRRLEEPKADRSAIKKLLKTLSDEIDAVEDDPLTLREGAPFPKSAKLAKRYGFRVCAVTD